LAKSCVYPRLPQGANNIAQAIPACFVTTCRSLNLGLVTKAKACKGVGQKGSLRVVFHAPENV